MIVLLFLKGKGLDIAGYPKVFASPNLASSGIEYFQDLKVKSPIFYCLYYNAYKIVNKFSKVLSLSEDDNKIRQKSLGYAFAVIFGVADKEQFEAMSRVQKKDIVHSVKFIIRKRANHIVACRNLMER
ncbi:MAG: hypothetical protein PF692_11085 [Kiritimatiellae bacterium]|nr:hypothetical protein [Kiritimatiellia bacterium]